MDQELIAYLDRRFEQIDARFDRLEEEVRHVRVEVEGLRDQIRLLAEGMINFDERLASFKGEVKRDLESIRGLFFPLHEALQARVHSLESWKETKERDPIEIIKERYGSPGQGRQTQAG